VRKVVLVALVVGSLVAASTAAARSPRSEKLKLAAADVAHARQGLIRLADLSAGWRSVRSAPSRGDVPQCPWQNYSALTTTADETADFSTRGAQLESRVEVLRTRGDALSVFRIDTKPGTAKCLGEELRKAFGAGAKLVAAKVVPGSRIADRTVRFRWTIGIGENRVEVVGIEFVRGRTIGSVVASVVGQPPSGVDALAKLMDSRLQVGLA
jgi:hypothetical protein